MKKSAKLFRLLAAVTVLAVTVLFSTFASAALEVNGVDISKEVNLVMYVMGPEALDKGLVVAELNKLTKRDLNCTVTVNNIDWGSWDTKYNLTLAAGEQVDLMYTAAWCMFNQHALKGAFMPLDDMLPKICPQTWKETSKEAWKAASRNGKILAVPNYFPDAVSWGIVYREDLRKKYNLPEIKDLATLEAYFDGIKKNEDILPFNVSGMEANSNTMLINGIQYGFGSQSNDPLNLIYTKPDQSKLKTIKNDIFSPAYEKYLKTMKRWSDKGFWSRSALQSKTGSGDLFREGKSAAAWDQSQMIYLTKTHDALMANIPTAEMKFWPLSRISGVQYLQPAMQNAMVVPKSAKYPERALLLLEKLRNDQTYWELTTYGIKGRNWDADAKGRYIMPSGVNADNNGYNIDGGGFSWGWRMGKFMRIDFTTWDEAVAITKEILAISKASKLDAFAYNNTAVKAKYDACTQIGAQYNAAFNLGKLDPVAKYLAEYRAKLKAAGVDDVFADFKKQLNAYCDANGYK